MIAICCSETVDGIASAAIVFRHAMLSNLPVEFSRHLHSSSIIEELKELSKQSNKIFVFLDTSLKADSIYDFELVKKNNKILYWNSSDEKSALPDAKMIDIAQKNVCSAELTLKRFLPNDHVAKELARFAHEVKFWKMENELSKNLNELIAFNFPSSRLIENLAKGIFWNDEFERFLKSQSEKKSAILDSLLKNLAIKQFSSYKFGFSYASSGISSADACEHILKNHTGVDVAAVIYRDGRIFFRRKDSCDCDLKIIAETLGGSGHVFASGAKLNINVQKEFFSESLSHLSGILQELYHQI